MGQPAARISDMHTCPMVTGVVPHVGGPITMGAGTVLIGKLPAARVSDLVTCVGPPDVIVKGSPTVFIEKMFAARLGDNTAHGGVIVLGCPTVFIGEAPAMGGVDSPSVGSIGTISDIADGIGAASQQGQAMSNAAESGRPFCEM